MMSAGVGHAGAVVMSEVVVNAPAGAAIFYPFRNTPGWTPGIEGNATRLRPGGSRSYWLPSFEPEPGPHDLALWATAPIFPSDGIFRFQFESEATSESAARTQIQRRRDRASQLERWEISQEFGTVRIRDAVRLLLNVGRETGRQRRPATAAAPGRHRLDGGNGGSMLAAILGLSLDQEMLDLIFSVLSPSLEPGGLISFSIAGLGNFVMVLSDEIGALKIVDLDGGNILVLRSRPQDFYAQSRQNLDLTSGGQRRRAVSRITFRQFLLNVRQFFVFIVQDPRFIGIFVIFSLLWLVWILYRRRV